MHQIPCRDLIHAHCVRSWLLSHGIEAEVIHENASGLYFPDLLPPQVAIADTDVPRYLELSKETDPPLDDSFVPPDEPELPKETVEISPKSPTLLQTMLFSVAFYATLAFAAYLVGALFHNLFDKPPLYPDWSRIEKDSQVDWTTTAVSWAIGIIVLLVGGALLWLVMRLTSRRDKNGQPPFALRCIALIVLFVGTDLIFIVQGAPSIFRHISELLEKPR
jgi:hypothetical protein